MRQIAVGLILTGLIATPAWAGETGRTSLRLEGALRGVSLTAATTTATAQAPAAEAEPKVTGMAGVDFPSVYFFRGYRQEGDPALTMQPYVDIAIAGESVSFNVGSWNSFHTGSLDGFYESDFYLAATIGKLKATYTAYLYPDDGAPNVHELMLSTTLDHKLNPSFALAFEFAKEFDLDKGIYFEAGVAPTVSAEDAPVTVTVPVKIGLSLKDYYFDDNGESTPFGYFSAGLTVGKSINDKLEVHGGVTVYALGSGLKLVNNDKAGQVVASVGLSTSF